MGHFETTPAISPSLMRFEDQRVKMVLRRFHLLKHLTTLLDYHESLYGERRLTFEVFHKRFPSFPILLAARMASRVAERCPPAVLFRHFENLFLLQHYLEVYSSSEEDARGRPVGMVIPFDGFRCGMIVHNGLFETGQTKMIHHLSEEVPPYRLTVEPFGRLLRFLDQSGWTPETPLPDSLAVQEATPHGDICFTPAMVKRIGSGPPLVIYSWITSLLQRPSPQHRHLILRLSPQERGIMATQTQIAAATGLSFQQVKRAMAFLVQKGLLCPIYHDGKRCICLVE